MSPRKIILSELSRAQDPSGAPRFTRPAEITGYGQAPERYQKTVNRLLQERLIEGQKDAEGRMALALNRHRLADIRKELRPFWARPTLWAVVGLAVTAVAAVLLGGGGAA